MGHVGSFGFLQVEGESEMGVIEEQNISSLVSACAGEGGEQCRSKQHYFSFFFFFLGWEKNKNLGNNPKIRYNRHNQKTLLKKRHIYPFSLECAF